MILTSQLLSRASRTSKAGPVSAPLITAAVVQAKPWQWAYYVVIILVGVTFLMIVFFCPETLYVPPASSSSSSHAERLERPESRGSSTKDEKEPELNQTVTHNDDEHQRGHVGVAYLPWQDWSRFFSDALMPFKQGE